MIKVWLVKRMEELINLNLSDNTIKAMLEICPQIKDMSNKEINEKIYILKGLDCSYNQLRNIISSNPCYLDRTNEEIVRLIKKLTDLGFNNLNILFDGNPYILNLDPFEIDDYINSKLNEGLVLDSIVDELETMPYLFNEM